MAKDINLDDIDWGDLDDDLGDFDINMEAEEPPKDKREAVTRSVKHIGKGYMSGITENKMKTATTLAKNSVPKYLSKETDTYAESKDAISEGLNEFRRNGGQTLKKLERLLPDNGVKHKLVSLREKFGLEDKQERSNKTNVDETMSTNIVNALGNIQEKQRASEIIRQSIESKRADTTNQILQSIYTESKFQRIFHAETTNKYYKKSLELQYKQLFITREQLEVTKAAFTQFTKQYESIIFNTSLPDTVKLRDSELISTGFKQKARDDMINSFYKKYNPYESIKKNLLNKISDFKDGASNGLNAAPYMIGEHTINYTNKYIGSKLGKVISSAMLDKDNDNNGTTFDNRTQDSIVNIIPNLLSKIYGELQVVRKEVTTDKELNVKDPSENKTIRPKTPDTRLEGDTLSSKFTNNLKHYKNNIPFVSNLSSNNTSITNEDTTKYQVMNKNFKLVKDNDRSIRYGNNNTANIDNKFNFNNFKNLDRTNIASTTGNYIGGVLNKLKNSAKIGYQGIDGIKKKYEEAKAEYFTSEEYKHGLAPSFDGWLKTMKYVVPDINNKITVKGTFKELRKLDRLIAGKMISGTFKGLGLGVKGTSKVVGLGSKALGTTASIMLDMLPLGLGNIVKAPFKLLSSGNKDKEENKIRTGSWINRLNIFGKKNKEGKEDNDKSSKSLLSKITSLFTSNKTLGLGLALGGITAILKNMGVSLTDVVDFSKKIFGAIKGVTSTLIDVGKYIGETIGNAFGFVKDLVSNPLGKVKNLLGLNNDSDNTSNKSYDTSTFETAGALAGAAVAGKGVGMVMEKIPMMKTAGKLSQLPYDATKTAVKTTVSIGTKIVTGIKDYVTNNWVLRKLAPNKLIKFFTKEAESTASKIDKYMPSVDKVKSSFNKVTKRASKKVGIQTAKTTVTMFAAKLLPALTGVGAVATLAMIGWELAWIVKYMLIDNMSFTQAVCLQLFDIKPTDKDTDDTDTHTTTTVPTTSVATSSTPSNITSNVGTSSSYSPMLNTTLNSNDSKEVVSPEGAFKKITQGDIDKLKVDAPGVNDSPFIKPNKQSSMGGAPADVNGLNPDLKNRVKLFAEEYFKYTGKKLEINSGKRDFNQQKAMWEADAKTEHTGNKWADLERARKAGGKYYGYNGGTVGYPTKSSQHVIGNAVDLNISAMPNATSINDKKPTPWLDNMLAKYGLKRSLTEWNGVKTGKERWHVTPFGAPPASPDEVPPETKDVPKEDRPNEDVMLANNNIASSSLSMGKFDNFVRNESSNISSVGGYNNDIFTSHMSGNNISLDTRELTNILEAQLTIQKNTMYVLEDIRTILYNNNNVTLVDNNTTNNVKQYKDVTSPVIDISRNYKELS